MIMLLLIVLGSYYVTRRIAMSHATSPGRPTAARLPPDVGNGGPTELDRWTALDDRQLTRLLDESSP